MASSMAPQSPASRLCQQQERKQKQKQAPGECSFGQLAALMERSSWQREQLAGIKRLPGYQFARLVYTLLGQLTCAKLYAYIGPSKEDGESFCDAEPSLELATGEYITVAHSSSNSSSSAASRRAAAALDRANARVFGPDRKYTWATLLARLVLAFCLCCSIGLLLSTTFQYHYDYYNFHLERFNATPWAYRVGGAGGAGGGGGRDATQLGRELVARVEQASGTLKLFGSFLKNRPFFAENCYTLMVLLCLFTYPGPLAFYRRRGPFDYHQLRLLLDWDQEQRNCNRMLCQLAERVALSSRVYMLVAIKQLRARYQLKLCFNCQSDLMVRLSERRGRLSTPQANNLLQRRSRPSLALQAGCGGGGGGGAEFEALLASQRAHLAEHKWTVARLKGLALANRLQPLDRCDVGQMNWDLLLQATLVTAIIFGCFIWNVCLFTSLPVYFNISYELGPMDVVSLVELAALNVLLTLGGAFYLSLVFLHCGQQVSLVKQLKLMMEAFVVRHKHVLLSLEPAARHCKCPKRLFGADAPLLAPLVEGLHANSTEALDAYYHLINEDLLLILMHYKICIQQMKPARRTFGFVLLCCLGMITIFPLIGRLHVPYLHDRESKLLYVLVCFIMIGLTDISIAPICWMNSRCLDLCHALWSLMAAIVQISDHPKLGPLLSGHSVWLLRKELQHPEHLRGQFAIVTMGLEFTYAELLKLHFWLNLVILSFCLELRDSSASAGTATAATATATRADSTLSLFSDPLGIISSFSL